MRAEVYGYGAVIGNRNCSAKRCNISTYFRNEKIRMRHKTIEDLSYPQYIHLRINEEKKHLFIERCERDMDAFSISVISRRESRIVFINESWD